MQVTMFTTMKERIKMAIKMVIKMLAHSASSIAFVICSKKCVMSLL